MILNGSLDQGLEKSKEKFLSVEAGTRASKSILSSLYYVLRALESGEIGVGVLVLEE